MTTTLNIPDDLVKKAKQLALRDGVTLTDMLVSGLSLRVSEAEGSVRVPVSSTQGGLCPGVNWESLQAAETGEAWHR